MSLISHHAVPRVKTMPVAAFMPYRQKTKKAFEEWQINEDEKWIEVGRERFPNDIRVRLTAEDFVIEQTPAQYLYSHEELKRKFNAHVQDWRHATGFLSAVSKKFMHPSYQKIIGMGPQVIPLILKEMEQNPTPHWFWALNALTEDNPLEPQNTANMSVNEIVGVWLEWGKREGHL